MPHTVIWNFFISNTTFSPVFLVYILKLTELPNHSLFNNLQKSFCFTKMGKKFFFFFWIKFRDFDLLCPGILTHIHMQEAFFIKLFKLNVFQIWAFLYNFLTMLKKIKNKKTMAADGTYTAFHWMFKSLITIGQGNCKFSFNINSFPWQFFLSLCSCYFKTLSFDHSIFSTTN